MSSDAIMKLGAWNRPATMPESLAEEVAVWETVIRGAGGESFHDRDPLAEGCLRAAAHWPAPAFVTDRPVEAGWALARRQGPVWQVVTVVPAADHAAAAAVVAERAHRLRAGRRWTNGDQELLRTLLATEVTPRDPLLAAEEGAARSLRSLLTLHLVEETTDDDSDLPQAVRAALSAGPVLWLTADARLTATAVLKALDQRKLVAVARTQRLSDKRDRGADLQQVLLSAVRNIFPAIPEEVAAAAAVRLTPAMVKLGRRPEMQGIVDAVADIRMERWRQAVAAEPQVAKRLEIMLARGEPGRARKRFRDQRAAERVEAELLEWRGDLRPVTPRRLGR